jgi:hypothetical protein
LHLITLVFTKLFKQSDYEDLAGLAQKVRPDIVLIAAPGSNDDELARGRKAMQEKLAIKVDVWAWGPSQFKNSPSWI